MSRLFIPALAIAVIAWMLLYGLRPKMRQQTWTYARHGLWACTIGLAVVFFIIGIFSIFGSVHGL